MRQGIQAELEDGVVREYGCYALCLLALAEHDAGKVFPDEAVLGFIGIARKAGYIGEECFVERPARLYNLAFGRDRYAGARRLADKPDAESYIVCNKKPMYAHFTAVIDGAPWDPLPPGRPGAKGYKPDTYRILV